MIFRSMIAICPLLLASAGALGLPQGEAHWPEYRGPLRNGDAGARELPLDWSEDRNVRWKRAIHDRGWSTPVVWGKQVWLTTATEDGHRLYALCADVETGEILHDLKLFEVEKPGHCNPLNSFASPSPVIAEGRVYVHFGTYGTACLDTRSGAVLWRRNDLHCEHLMGPGSSPCLIGDHLVLHLDGADQQYAVALDRRSGKTVWKVARAVDFGELIPDQRKAYSTPLPVAVGAQVRIVSTGARASYAYDPLTGKESWRVVHGGFSMASRPVAGGGLVFLNTGFPLAELWAVRLGGTGDVTGSRVVWKQRRNVPKLSSPLLVGGLLFLVDDGGVASCLEARSGKLHWIKRLCGPVCASPIHAGGRVYILDRDGSCTVLAAKREFEVLARNLLPDGFMASPAVAGQALILRTHTHLYRIEEGGE